MWEGGGRILVFFYRNIKTIIQNIKTPKGQINWKVLYLILKFLGISIPLEALEIPNTATAPKPLTLQTMVTGQHLCGAAAMLV